MADSDYGDGSAPAIARAAADQIQQMHAKPPGQIGGYRQKQTVDESGNVISAGLREPMVMRPISKEEFDAP